MNITEYLKNKCKDIIIVTRHINKICFGLNAKIFISGNTFKFREILKNNRYYYSDKKWYKNIRANEFLKEKANIEKLLPSGQGLKIDIEY